MKRKALWLLIPALVLALAGGAVAGPDQIDYVAMAISPAANFDGGSGNFRLTNSVAGGTVIDFNLIFSIAPQGNTTIYGTNGIAVTFGVNNPNPGDPSVYFGPAGSTATSYTYTFKSASDIATTQARIIAPAADGDYNLKIDATAGATGGRGLHSQSGIVIHFTVGNSAPPPCNTVATSLSLTLEPACVVYHATSTTFAATLTRTSDGAPLGGKLINFTVETDNTVRSAATDANGVATLTFNPSALPVGNYAVNASFGGESCAYEASGISATLGVKYNFLGYQPPVKIDGAGVGLFSGKVIPVKIKIADAFGAPVPDAAAFVFFGATSVNAQVDTVADALANTNGDSGNLMRYDPLADQYIFNWDVSKVANGSYNIRIYAGEGSCANAHLATVTLQKSGGGKK
jgi:hypothetical protein